jgi:Xaa-Pro aminopeptidase
MSEGKKCEMFPAENYRMRRKVLAKEMQGLGIFPANPPSPANYANNTLPFVQDGCFAYYFGIPQPGLVGAIDFDAGESFLFGEDPTLDDLIWLGAATSMREWAERSGSAHARPLSDLPTWLLDSAGARFTSRRRIAER